MNLRRFIFGNPLKTANLDGQRLSKTKALAIFSSDLLSTIAYASEEILIALGAAFAASFSFSVALIISALVLILGFSYLSTIKEYPTGGGAFSVAHKNLGKNFGILAAASLSLGYTLTVAVSLSASIQAITSAFPSLGAHSVGMCIFALVVIMLINLRGLQESATMLAIPTYCFIFVIFVMIIYGLFVDAQPPKVFASQVNDISKSVNDLSLTTVLVLVQGFVSGCTVMSGIESISGGVPSFKKPKVKNSQVTLCCVVCILIFMFLGVTYLANKFDVLPSQTETVISQIAKNVTGTTGVFYYLVQIMTSVILLMAANTSFSGFPRLASVLAKEKYIPTSFANLGDRLAFSNGIVLLAIISAFLLILFKGNTHALIPLYSVVIFLSFTLSQAGLVKHLVERKEANWYLKAFVSTIGFFATMFVLVMTICGKFFDGAWIVVIVVPSIMFVFKKIKDSYEVNYKTLDPKSGGLGKMLKTKNFGVNATVVVPVTKIHKGTLAALKFAQNISDNVIAVIVNINPTETDKLKLSWKALNFRIPLVILESPYRSVITPFLEFLDEVDRKTKNGEPAMVIMPSFVPGKIWQNILHNQSATILKTALLYKRKSTDKPRIIVDVPYQL